MRVEVTVQITVETEGYLDSSDTLGKYDTKQEALRIARLVTGQHLDDSDTETQLGEYDVTSVRVIDEVE